MIKEAYCSYEVAKLLEEKGFDEPCDNYYDQSSDEPQQLTLDEMYYSYDEFVKAPTHQMAMAWLRKKKIEIIVYPFSDTVTENIMYTVDICTPTLTRQQGHLRGVWKSYEEAVEAALKYVLENLI